MPALVEVNLLALSLKASCCLQSSSLSKVWQDGDATAGTVQSCAEFQFYLDVDAKTGVEMVHISEAKQARQLLSAENAMCPCIS